MFPEKSLRARFALQLATAGAMLIVIFSVMLYHYTKITILEGVVFELKSKAKQFADGEIEFSDFKAHNILAKIQKNSNNLVNLQFTQEKQANKTFLTLIYPCNDNIILTLKKDTTKYTNMVDQILINILVVNATVTSLVLFYAMFLSRILLFPIKILSKNLLNLNENRLEEIKSDQIPNEFKPLGDSLNQLIKRLKIVSNYQKELFTGAAHELKTPLAVMKTKNEVTLIKPREPQKYIEALKNNNNSIDQMNKMISSILAIGRQEGAQFEEATKIDIIAFLYDISRNFLLLAKAENKDIKTDFSPPSLTLNLQITLLTNIIQNFIQNAIKFSPPNSVILVSSEIKDDKFIIKVIDEGEGIKQNQDLFAPFKRYGDKTGAGLGLFLAKNAAATLGGDIEIKNRSDKNGAIASFSLPINKT